jgi:hypothetical protein
MCALLVEKEEEVDNAEEADNVQRVFESPD